MPWDDDPDDSGEDFEPYDDGAGEELPCPSCGEPVYEEADVCPSCGDYITPGRRPAGANVPRWMFVLGVIGVLGTIWALLMQ
ncbi:zinc ribbon domain-containing protein [Alienimonas californiensis]|uniref:Zinc-ribbon domain-containing protein n=1 Tax=Alienimonas californiensis TaxID=2527989 RepID=A0A517PAD3_9PLAN|nr:zinc ribbon domain-containing protein [Alienimonas californiensis]QDT16337.1 hypothetical protein CA12_24380 [Alienimonas californiensis]